MIQLNKEQIKAINTTSGNLLIIASAGTGKTTTIVERYANLVINHNYKPQEIMMTTFTNKAAKDMIEKVYERAKKVSPYIGTMHSLFLRILREHSQLILPKEKFTIIDDSDRKKIIKQILVEEKISEKSDNIHYFLGKITKFKNLGIFSEYLESGIDLDENDKTKLKEISIEDRIIRINANLKRLVPKIYKRYDEILRKRNLIDLDDILLLTFKLLNENKDIKDKYSKQFKIIMVDEAQDLNFVQMKILKLLQNNNLCLIGDDCQNIYEWRGSSNDLVFKFNKHYNTITLKDNYRSTENIISAVNETINSMNFKIEKELRCTREKGNDIIVKPFYSFDEEVDFIVSEVRRLIKNKTKKDEIAILFRTNNIGKTVERELRRNKIPCHLSKSRNFFDREEVKDVLSFLKLKINPYSSFDFERVILLLDSIGKVKVKKIEELAESLGYSLVQALEHVSSLSFSLKVQDDLTKLKLLLSDDARNPIIEFMRFFRYREKLTNKYKYESDKIEEKLENINVLIELFKDYEYVNEGINDFLDSLISIEKKEKDKDRIILSTIHSAKGLEWKYVFLVSCNEGILPFYNGELSKIERDSELRLFYVALSRAKDFLTITHSEYNGWKIMPPSQFLDIIQQKYNKNGN